MLFLIPSNDLIDLSLMHHGLLVSSSTGCHKVVFIGADRFVSSRRSSMKILRSIRVRTDPWGALLEGATKSSCHVSEACHQPLAEACGHLSSADVYPTPNHILCYGRMR